MSAVFKALFAAMLVSTSSGCGSSTSGGGDGGGTVDIAQTPPEGDAAVSQWLDAGYYKQWHCQPAAHASRPPSPHGFNRICSNDKLSDLGASGDFPEGSSNVKELWDKIGGSVIGHAVYLKTQADSAGGANWYWYEARAKVIADGLGDGGPPKTICVACHSAAGPSFAKTSRDFVYTQVE